MRTLTHSNLYRINMLCKQPLDTSYQNLSRSLKETSTDVATTTVLPESQR